MILGTSNDSWFKIKFKLVVLNVKAARKHIDEIDPKVKWVANQLLRNTEF